LAVVVFLPGAQKSGLMLGIAITLIIVGAGAWSLNTVLVGAR
jgi:uncharacterized membrane protein YphA (DoxX/SURF4 family)